MRIGWTAALVPLTVLVIAAALRCWSVTSPPEQYWD
jgi:hypothetical protein